MEICLVKWAENDNEKRLIVFVNKTCIIYAIRWIRTPHALIPIPTFTQNCKIFIKLTPPRAESSKMAILQKISNQF